MISVIIPIYNSEKYLKDCLLSILSQSLGDMEIICVNDGSTDSSVEIVNKLIEVDDRIKLFSQQNRGRSSARNLGLEKAEGDLVCFVDADDLLPGNSLELLYRSITKHNSDASVGSISVDYDVHHGFKEPDSAYYTIRKNGIFTVTDDVIDSFHCSSCACLFRRDIIEKYTLRFPEGLNYEDAYWHWCYFSLCRTVSFVDRPVYKYIRRPGSVMSQTFEQKEQLSIQHLFIAEKIYDFFNVHNLVKGRERTLLHLVEQFFWLSVKYSPKHEISLVAYEGARLLKKMNLPLDGFETLLNLKNGNLHFLYAMPDSKISHSELAAFLRLKAAINIVLPKGSIRRRFIYRCARSTYKCLSKFRRA